ncbi:10407_t:CDS:2 [Ambispora leptoticha]|uniref:10407_t:CDS:1 n=1 Tax=Ambispora leptoticha TaxID=144679 RepID=A0A9N9ANG5_9GLOM|nr:10407_t:CDS:2 [Ambispora leptoticha]
MYIGTLKSSKETGLYPVRFRTFINRFEVFGLLDTYNTYESLILNDLESLNYTFSDYNEDDNALASTSKAGPQSTIINNTRQLVSQLRLTTQLYRMVLYYDLPRKVEHVIRFGNI